MADGTTFPLQAFTDFIDSLRRTRQVPWLQLLVDGRDILSWGLDQARQMGASPESLRAPEDFAEDEDDDALAGRLEGLVAQHRQQGQRVGFAVPSWLLPLVAQLLQRLLTQGA